MSTNSIEYMREWRRTHPENVSEHKKKYKRIRSANDRNYYIVHREESIEYSKRYRSEHKEEIRAKKLIKKYGESLDYNKLFIKQNGCCAICGKHQSELNKPLFVDHDHITNQVRGLLCTNCNLAIGLLNDNIEILNLAIEYLKS